MSSQLAEASHPDPRSSGDQSVGRTMSAFNLGIVVSGRPCDQMPRAKRQIHLPIDGDCWPGVEEFNRDRGVVGSAQLWELHCHQTIR